MNGTLTIAYAVVASWEAVWPEHNAACRGVFFKKADAVAYAERKTPDGSMRVEDGLYVYEMAIEVRSDAQQRCVWPQPETGA